MAEPAVVFRHVSKTFDRESRPYTAIADLDFEISRGEYVCVLGRTGCGKSTSANLLLGLEAATAGRMSVFGIDPHRSFTQLRGRIGCIFQGDRLLPWRSAIDNVRLPLEIMHIDERRVGVSPREWLGRLGLAGFEAALPHQLSGGMRQRVAIARALVSDAELIIADEAFGHLDEVTGRALRQDFGQLARAGGKTVYHITHSIDEALSIADRILVFGRPGKVIGDFELVENAQLQDKDALRANLIGLIEGSSFEARAAA